MVGALVISTGAARIGARTTNTENASTDHRTTHGDQDVQSVNSKIYSQPLTDLAMLTFDITPTASGAIYFRCVKLGLVVGRSAAPLASNIPVEDGGCQAWH